MIRIDAPTDVVFLDARSPILRNVSWITPKVAGAPSLPFSPSEWKDRGNELFKRRQWLSAAVAYSEGLKLDPDHHLLLLNRSITYLQLGWFNAAARDAEAVRSMNLEDPSLRRKAVFRALKAYYGLRRYQDVIRIVQSCGEDTETGPLSLSASARLHEQLTGNYDWVAIHKGTRRVDSRPDIAAYRGPVKVKSVTEGDGHRGLIVTRDVHAGELLVSVITYYEGPLPLSDVCSD